MDSLRPKSSPFIETLDCKNIYQTWNGEALINFKWNTYGKIYYYIFWIAFIILLGCFTTATLPQQYLTEEIRKGFLITTIIIGLFLFVVETRQAIYNFYDHTYSLNYKKWYQFIGMYMHIN